MTDDLIIEQRLAEAFRRLSDLAPAMDDEVIAREAIATARPGSAAGWLEGLRGTVLVPTGSRALRTLYVVVLVTLLAIALVIAAAAGSLFRNDLSRPPGADGAIVYSFIGDGHVPIITRSIGADGAGDRVIEAGRCPTYAHDGSALAWVIYDGRAASLAVSDPDGSRPRTIPLVDDAEQAVSFALSADGTQVAWFKPIPSAGSTAELWVAPTKGGSPKRIVSAPTDPAESYDSPLWSPDGRLVTFDVVVRDGETGEARRTGIDVVAADGSGRHRLTSRPGLVDDGMAWSPDSRFLAYAGVPDDENVAPSQRGASIASLARDLFIVGADGVDDHSLGATSESERQPGWSPDGKYLAFMTSVDGGFERLSTVRMDGSSALGPPTIGPSSSWFVWSPDGRELLWQELATLDAATHRVTLRLIDRDLRQPSTTLRVENGLIACPPSWQRLEP